MNLTDNQQQILRAIKSKLVRGDIRAIAENTGMTEDYVSKVLNPENDSYNEEIVEAAAKIISDREQKEKELLGKLSGEPELEAKDKSQGS